MRSLPDRDGSPQTQRPTLDVLTALAIDQRGWMAKTSVVNLEFWKPLTYVSEAWFPPGAHVAMCKQTDDVLTALAVDRDGRLQASVARVGFWKPPVAIQRCGRAAWRSRVAMAKQTDFAGMVAAAGEVDGLRVRTAVSLLAM